ncbi:MAG: hypothetical protein KIT09_04495 [Bryobacteraceae bacterium]|nr:hypothetical protein [Bryobacteraceae bacterium]
MTGQVLELRLRFLLNAQHADGGWGYAPGGPPWVEPTAYAILALHGKSGGTDAADRGWQRLRSWQQADGSWPPAPGVQRAHWTTALCVTAHCVRREYGEGFLAGVNWLLGNKGAEGTFWKRVMYRALPTLFGHDPSIVGWPWLPGTGSWVEPTCHALIALRKADDYLSLPAGLRARLRERVAMGEQMLLGRRAADGGWNYGNRLVLGHALPSYPELTAIASLAMRGAAGFQPPPLGTGASGARMTSRLARAWTAICLQAYGQPAPEVLSPTEEVKGPVHVAALEAIGAPDGNFRLFETESVP